MYGRSIKKTSQSVRYAFEAFSFFVEFGRHDSFWYFDYKQDICIVSRFFYIEEGFKYKSKIMKKSVLLADDHAIVRTGLAYLLQYSFNIRSITEVETLPQLLEVLNSRSFSHLILDLQMEEDNALMHLASIRKLQPKLAILVYTMSSEEVFGKHLLDLGVKGVVNKLEPVQEVQKALEQFLDGRTVFGEQTRLATLEDSKQNWNLSPFEILSSREMAVTLHLLNGKAVKDICDSMDLKKSTVVTYKSRLFTKLKVNSLVELVRLADLYGIKTKANTSA